MLRFRHPLLSLILICTGVYGIASSLFAGETTDEVSVASTPTGARVLVDGEVLGNTPLFVELATDSDHTILIVREGYVAVETLVQPVLGWGLVGKAVTNGFFLGLAQSVIELSTGGGHELEPNEVHVHLEPAGPPVPEPEVDGNHG